MKLMRGQIFQKTFAMALVGILVLGQIFSCCLVNQKIGRFVQVTLQSIYFKNSLTTQTTMHSCCVKLANDKNSSPQRNQDQMKHKDCCIQDANDRTPQIASEQVSIPAMFDKIEGNLLVTLEAASKAPELPNLRSSSYPPLFLTQLRILI